MEKPAIEKKDRSYLYIGTSILIIFFGIIITSVINKTNTGIDIRARAGAVTGVRYTANLGAVNTQTGTIIVVDVRPADNDQVNHGQWTVAVPADFDYRKFIPGDPLLLTIDAQTFKVASRTMTAKKIEKK